LRMDRLEVLRTFVAVAELSSFAKAARRLRISPTAATRAIAALEEELGVAVLRRTTRSVGLTEEGAAFLERCRPALAELEDAARSARGHGAEPRGTLVMTAPVVFGRMYIRPLATELLRLDPKLNVQPILTDRICRLVDEGIDLALRIAELSDSALRAVRVGELRRVLVASPSYLAARGVPATVAALPKHNLIAFDNFTPNGEWRFRSPPRSAIRVEPRLLTDRQEGQQKLHAYDDRQRREHYCTTRCRDAGIVRQPPVSHADCASEENGRGPPRSRSKRC